MYYSISRPYKVTEAFHGINVVFLSPATFGHADLPKTSQNIPKQLSPLQVSRSLSLCHSYLLVNSFEHMWVQKLTSWKKWRIKTFKNIFSFFQYFFVWLKITNIPWGDLNFAKVSKVSKVSTTWSGGGDAICQRNLPETMDRTADAACMKVMRCHEILLPRFKRHVLVM